MSKHPFVMLRALPEELESLAELALDLRWTWVNSSDRLWKMLDPDIWEQTRNPRAVLQYVSHDRLEHAAHDPAFRDELRQVVAARRNYLAGRGWCRERYPLPALKTIAYFSMEFGLGEALPLYAGGLGILAGDMLKTASDLDVPMVGIGLLYQEGYFRQLLDGNGWQIEAFPYNDPISLPIQPVMPATGEWLRVPLELPGRTVFLRVWFVQVGRTTLYLLDSNDQLNSPFDRGITGTLYDARPELRLIQEMVLGIGGWRMLLALGIEADICHLNEGHAAFAVLERARSHMQNTGQSFAEAWCATRAGTIFTTHTAVAAGFDAFPPDLIRRTFRDYVAQLGMTMEELLRLGRKDRQNPEEPFTMAALAMRGSLLVNGVSKLHGAVSRRLFQPIYPRWPEREVPVASVTNGVHVPSWNSEWADTLWSEACGKERWQGPLEELPKAIRDVSDEDLWKLRAQGRQALVNYARQRLVHQYQLLSIDPEAVSAIREALDPQALTIGFARRFTAYKRPTLLLHDPERLARLLNHPKRPVQLVVAGKAHPQDEEGKRLVQQFVRFARSPEVRRRVIFIADYDMALAQHLVRGVDVWINTPRRPWEACGTSGMKVLVNGGLNLSEQDGWWAEAYAPEVGWAVGDGREHDDVQWDTVEAGQLYDLLEGTIVPEFYTRDARGIPGKWVDRIRESMARLTPAFSSNRMLREYVETLYLPATKTYRQRATKGERLVKQLLAWQAALEQHWPSIRFGEVRIAREDGLWRFLVSIYLGGLAPAAVRVELYADPEEGQSLLCRPLIREEAASTMPGWHVYQGSVKSERPSDHFTPRVVPTHPEAAVPIEAHHIAWAR
ncbi:MAG: alpha-glucan family phosphorylase [Nitrospira sp.]|nr:alpha-glucan family phosphorylase [Nitrospira sp.]